jgi:hypothetical protein
MRPYATTRARPRARAANSPWQIRGFISGRSEPVSLTCQGAEASPEGDFDVRSGPGTVRLAPDSARAYIRTRLPGRA